MKPVLLVGHDRVETFGLAPPVLEAEGLDLLEHDASQGDALPEVGDLSGIVVFGGEMNVDQTDRHPFLLRERELVRAAVEHGVPYLGICLGAQLLARALGVPVFRAPVREIGFSPLSLTEDGREDPLVSVFSSGDMVFHWHEDTFDLPPGATLLATGDAVRVQAYRTGAAWGLQFHFEVDEGEMEGWLADAGPGLKDSWGKSAEEIREEAARYLATQERRARELFRRFAGEVRGASR